MNIEEFENDRRVGLRPVVVGVLVFEDKILFAYKEEHQLWQFPQGGIENGESLERALEREMKEELGWDIPGKNLILFQESEILFPKRMQGSRELKTDDGKEVVMNGKKYYFVYKNLKEKPVFLEEKSEFDEIRWCSFEEATELVKKIYQKNKRIITIEALGKLRKRGLVA